MTSLALGTRDGSAGAGDETASDDAAVPVSPTMDQADVRSPDERATEPGIGTDAGTALPPLGASGAAAIEIGGRPGPDPTRYGDWEMRGRCIDF